MAEDVAYLVAGTVQAGDVGGAVLVDLDTALAEGDVISVHMNLTADNKYFFTKETFAKMKKHPIFINEGRG